MSPKEIRSRRLALGMSVEKLAEELGVTPEVVRDLENGDRRHDAQALRETFARLEQRERGALTTPSGDRRALWEMTARSDGSGTRAR